MRSWFIACLLAVGFGCAAAGQDYPAHTITLIVPYPPGGGVDAMARIVAEKFSAALGEQVIPYDWTWVLLLALGSQVIGQGLLVYGIGHVPPLIVGLALLTQPAISAFVGWSAYGETLSPADWLGAAAIGTALVLVRLPERGLRRAAVQPS